MQLLPLSFPASVSPSLSLSLFHTHSQRTRNTEATQTQRRLKSTTHSTSPYQIALEAQEVEHFPRLVALGSRSRVPRNRAPFTTGVPNGLFSSSSTCRRSPGGGDGQGREKGGFSCLALTLFRYGYRYSTDPPRGYLSRARSLPAGSRSWLLERVALSSRAGRCWPLLLRRSGSDNGRERERARGGGRGREQRGCAQRSESQQKHTGMSWCVLPFSTVISSYLTVIRRPLTNPE